MSKNKINKLAWEQVYDHKNDYEDQLIDIIRENPLAYFDEPLKSTLNAMHLKGMTIAQFCTNNGRELLSVCYTKHCRGLGFDIAENMVASANAQAKTLPVDATFFASDIEEISDVHQNTADVLIVTVGAFCWFADLTKFFAKAAMVLKDDGILLVHESHPYTSVLAAPDEPAYDAANPMMPAYDYFAQQSWQTKGMGYMSDLAETHTFHSYSHTLSDVLQAIIKAGFTLEVFLESPIDYSQLFNDIHGGSLPLSMFFKARLQKKQ